MDEPMISVEVVAKNFEVLQSDVRYWNGAGWLRCFQNAEDELVTTMTRALAFAQEHPEVLALARKRYRRAQIAFTQRMLEL